MKGQNILVSRQQLAFSRFKTVLSYMQCIASKQVYKGQAYGLTNINLKLCLSYVQYLNTMLNTIEKSSTWYSNSGIAYLIPILMLYNKYFQTHCVSKTCHFIQACDDNLKRCLITTFSTAFFLGRRFKSDRDRIWQDCSSNKYKQKVQK